VKTLFVFDYINSANWSSYFYEDLPRKYLKFRLNNSKYDLKWLDKVNIKRFLKKKKQNINQVCDFLDKSNVFFEKIIFVDACGYDVKPLKDMGCKVFGFLHGGSYEPFDIAYQSIKDEQEYFKLFDMLFVQTDHHYNLLRHYKNLKIEKVLYPLIDYWEKPAINKNKIYNICFAGRLSIDKGFDLLRNIENISILRQDNKNISKEKYLELLSQFDFCAVPSRKETLGIIPIECIKNGVIPLVPDMLCFKEVLGNNKDSWEAISHKWNECPYSLKKIYEDKFKIKNKQEIILSLNDSIETYTKNVGNYEKIIDSL